jgi:hypothetical protein
MGWTVDHADRSRSPVHVVRMVRTRSHCCSKYMPEPFRSFSEPEGTEGSEGFETHARNNEGAYWFMLLDRLDRIADELQKIGDHIAESLSNDKENT